MTNAMMATAQSKVTDPEQIKIVQEKLSRVTTHCDECGGSGFGRTEAGTLCDGSCSVCYDLYVEEHYGRRL